MATKRMLPDERVAQILAEKIQKHPQMLTEFMSPSPDAQQATPQDERRLFWTRAPGADESSLRQSEMDSLLKQGVDPSQVSDVVESRVMAKMFPTRLGIITAGARALSPRDQIKFAERMARLGPPSASDGGPSVPPTEEGDVQDRQA